MIQVSLDLYLDGEWKNFHVYNQVKFDDRKDGQLRSGMCFIRTETKTRFKPMRKARLNVMENGEIVKQISYFAYFKSQKIDREWWMHEVTLIDPAKRVQGEMINGLRVVQNSDYSITLYSTFQRLCNTTPLRLVSQENVYNCTTDERIVSLMKKIRSPEYAWSCRTLFWECLKEIGMDMGAYFPTVEWDDNGKYIISFIPTEEIVKTVTDFPYSSYAECEDINQVCSEIDTDISNVIATNQGSASVVFPSQNGWITPRTDDIRLTDQNCEIQVSNVIEKIIKISVNQKTIEVEGGTLYDLTGDEELDITAFIPEYKEYQTLTIDKSWTGSVYNFCKNIACYWVEDSNKIILVPNTYGHRGDSRPAASNMILEAIMTSYNGNTGYGNRPTTDEIEYFTIEVNGETHLLMPILNNYIPYRDCEYRVEFVSRDTSTKIRAVKQEKCDYEYVVPFNQRAEIVDSTSLGRELFKTVNQMGVRYFIAVNKYLSLNDVLPVGTAYVDTDGVYILTSNQFEITNHDHYDVAHSFSKNWAMVSSYLKQNKQYRNTKIPTDILVRNLHYQDYFVISDKLEEDRGGILTSDGVLSTALVFAGGSVGTAREINNMALYFTNGGSAFNTYTAGVVVSASSFGVNNSIVLSAKMKNNLSAGKILDVDNDYYCHEMLYTLSNGEFKDGKATIQFGILDSALHPNRLPFSYINELSLSFDEKINLISKPVKVICCLLFQNRLIHQQKYLILP